MNKILYFLFFTIIAIGCNGKVDVDPEKDPKEEDNEVTVIEQNPAIIIPPNYEGFKPPAAGEWFTDPAFGTPIKRLTDEQNILGWNSERAMFSADDKYFAIAKSNPYKLGLFDGRTGDFIKDLPVSWKDNSEFRWSYDPQMLVYPKGNRLMAYNVETDEETILKEFPETLGKGTKNRLCGGDGNDFDDSGEWLLLNMGDIMFAYNIRTGEEGPKKDMSAYDWNYCTLSASGNYILANAESGQYLFTRDWESERRILPNNSHLDFGYLNGTEECLVSRIPEWNDGKLWWFEHGVGNGSFLAARLSDGKIFELLRTTKWFSPMVSGVAGSNKQYVCLAMRGHKLNPTEEWHPYFGELILIPLKTGEVKPIRLAHHRCRDVEGGIDFWNQPEQWINHAGDRLFFRSNMDNFLNEDAKHDLYMIELDL